ncbi:hypothetical protein F5888DRAFT_1847754 [Russula emetica]|nr:hypothetical protein F5888DRAFT_1847754 [Russula emetica]
MALENWSIKMDGLQPNYADNDPSLVPKASDYIASSFETQHLPVFLRPPYRVFDILWTTYFERIKRRICKPCPSDDGGNGDDPVFGLETKPSQGGSPSMYQVLTSRCPGAALFKMASSLSGVQVALSGGTPTSAVSPTSSVLSPQGVRGMPMAPCHPAAGGGCQLPSTVPSPVSPTLAGGLTATRPWQTFEGYLQQLHHSIGSEVLPESDREDDCARLGQPLPDGSLEAREREYSISGAFRSRSRSLGCAHAHCLIQGFGGTSWFSIELVLGHMPQPSSPLATGAVRLGVTSDVDGSEGALSNLESHTFGLSVAGGVSLLPWRAGVRARMLENDLGQSSSSSAVAATVAVLAVMSVCSRSANTFLAFATSTIITTSIRRLEHGADIVRNGTTYIVGWIMDSGGDGCMSEEGAGGMEHYALSIIA